MHYRQTLNLRHHQDLAEYRRRGTSSPTGYLDTMDGEKGGVTMMLDELTATVVVPYRESAS